MSINNPTSRRFSLALLPTVLFCVTACGSGGSSDKPVGLNTSFSIFNTQGSVSGDMPIVVRENVGVYFLSEALTGAAGISLNIGDDIDLDVDDQVAYVVQLDTRSVVNTEVASRDAEILGDDVYLDVIEAEDSRDHNGDGQINDRVLLHFDRSEREVSFVATLDPSLRGRAFVVAGDRLYFSEFVDPASQAGEETSLRFIENGSPLVAGSVRNTIADGSLSPILLGESQGLISLVLDESVELRSLNGDADSLDRSVLALLDSTSSAARVKSTGLAMANDSEPRDLVANGVSDWTVAFLVDETAQGGASLNDQRDFANATLVASCAGTDDTDANDRVLHFLEFASFVAGSSMPVNTGLAGDLRVIVVDGAVATLSPEFDSNCDLNEDGDTGDTVARWTSTSLPLAPPVTVAEMHAICTDLPGGSNGLSSLGNRLVAVISEEGDRLNLDTHVAENDLVAWLDPRQDGDSEWTFSHQSSTRAGVGTGIFEDLDGDGVGDPEIGAPEPFAGASWMAPEETSGRLGITFMESVPGENLLVGSLNTNTDCEFEQKDLDLADALPVWLDFESGPILDFDGLGYATDMENARVMTRGSVAYFIVSEAADSVDYNDDGLFTSKFIFRNPVSECRPVMMSPASDLLGPLLYTDGQVGAMFYADESFGGEDLNGDNDEDDMVVRYFRF